MSDRGIQGAANDRRKELLAPHRRRRPSRPDPQRTALLVVDPQVHFREMLEPALPHLLPVLDRFRERGWAVVFTRHSHLDPRIDGGMMAEWWDALLIDGEEDAERVPEVRPGEGELLIEKRRYSAFLHTPLEEWLHVREIENLVIGGVMTHLCCETTARDAFMRDFRVFFLIDGTATCRDEYQISTLRNLAYGFAYLVTCGEILGLLQDG